MWVLRGLFRNVSSSMKNVREVYLAKIHVLAGVHMIYILQEVILTHTSLVARLHMLCHDIILKNINIISRICVET
jgi:hypothetical protein